MELSTSTSLTPEALSACRAGAAEQGVNSRQQFAHPEGLGDVIIGAKVKPDDLVNFLALGSEHQDGCGDLFRAKLFADVIAAQARKHHIQHN